MLLETLKTQTRSQHSRLEQLNGLPATRADYERLLERFLGFVEPWEKRLADRVAETDLLRAGREKTSWLEEDLGKLGWDADEIASAPRCTDLPDANSRAALLGVCYVLEGSTLGGQIMARHAHEVLGFEPGTGDRYFRSYGADVGPRWQAFRAELLLHSSPEADAEIVQAAQDTFEKLAAWFSPEASGRAS